MKFLLAFLAMATATSSSLRGHRELPGDELPWCGDGHWGCPVNYVNKPGMITCYSGQCNDLICCEPAPTCNGYGCPNGYSSIPYSDRVCTDGTCTDAYCCKALENCGGYSCPSPLMLMAHANYIYCDGACDDAECCMD